LITLLLLAAVQAVFIMAVVVGQEVFVLGQLFLSLPEQLIK
jgi:hypothetical protein